MKQKGQAKQNTKKEETLNWTSSAETVAPVEPVTMDRSNRSGSDTPMLRHRCNLSVQSKEAQVAPIEPVVPN